MEPGGAAPPRTRGNAEGMMRSLIAEDDFTSRTLLQTLLSQVGDCDAASNGREAVDAFIARLQRGSPYDLVCLDIMMPELDGQAALKEMRQLEADHGILPGAGAKIIMTTALDDPGSIMQAFREQCDAYLVKPIRPDALREQLRDLKLLDRDAA
jgi:two-component system chemotaxis response regulator CheY